MHSSRSSSSVRRFAAVISISGVAFAASPAAADFLGTFEDWEAHARGSGASKVCYAATVPAKSEGKYSKRGDVFLLVTNRPAAKQTGVVSLEAGYGYGEKSKITATVGDDNFAMFPNGDVAFAFEDPPLVKAMIAGATLVIKGTSARGTLTTDTFSLKGFTAALKAANKACGVKG